MVYEDMQICSSGSLNDTSLLSSDRNIKNGINQAKNYSTNYTVVCSQQIGYKQCERIFCIIPHEKAAQMMLVVFKQTDDDKNG